MVILSQKKKEKKQKLNNFFCIFTESDYRTNIYWVSITHSLPSYRPSDFNLLCVWQLKSNRRP